MQNQYRFNTDSQKNPLPDIIFGEIVMFVLFFLLAACSNSERWYVVALILANLVLPLILRRQFNDKKAFDDFFDTFFTDVWIASIATFGVAAELGFIKQFITAFPDGDLKFIAFVMGFQKLPMVVIKIRRNIKEFKKN